MDQGENKKRAPKIGKRGRIIIASLVVIGLVNAASGNSQNAQNASAPQTETPTQAAIETTPAAEAKPEPIVTKQTKTETQPVGFSKTTVQDATLEQGQTRIKTAGVEGVKTLTYEITTTDGKETDKKLVGEAVTKAPVTEVTAVGSKAKAAAKPNCDPNYSPCIPYVSYDLNCPDVGMRVSVIGTDRHRLDADKDGTGCDSY
jgi:resuscitation-promoting factor RpfB